MRPKLPIIACLGLTVLLVIALFRVVDLTPRVGEAFFFSKQDPQARADDEITRMFPESPLIILAAEGDIRSARYLHDIAELSDDLARLPDVTGVQSLSRGPKNLDDAVKSPLWSRLLIARDSHSSFLLVSVRQSTAADTLVRSLEEVRHRFDRPGFTVTVSGVPYVNELIAQNLGRDLRVFSLAALGIFGLVLLAIFRSAWVLAGMFIACVASSAATLMATHLLQIPIGPLTANLSTMVFVMTLSPMVFLTFNRRQVGGEKHLESGAAVRETIRRTITPSFWSSVCMLLGFVSLLFVPSTPMRHLGIAGAIGAAMAFLSAYLLYPPFLIRATVARHGVRAESVAVRDGSRFFARRHGYLVAGVLCFTVIGAYGLLRLNTDPELPSYFKRGSNIRTGLETVDESGGSSPLKLVIEDQHLAPLNTKEAYHRIRALQAAIEADPDVGSVVSLAMVLGEARRPWIVRLLPTADLIRILDRPKYGEVSRQLINPEHDKTLLLLRMRETGRTTPRATVIERLEGVVERAGFHTVMVGGTYNLLNQMSRLLSSSILSGVLLLLGIFTVMGLGFSRSPRVAVAMLATLAIIPVVVRGYIAYLGMPLDFITASAANIDLGMGVDAMIYLTIAARRSGWSLDRWAAWSKACSQLWRPIGTSLVVICSGFGIFLLSTFPPTQRFGVFVIFGSMTAATTALLLFPWLASSPKPARIAQPLAPARSVRRFLSILTFRAPS